MSYKISVHKTCCSYTGLDTFTNKVCTLQNEIEYERVRELCKDEKNMASPFKASIIPIRTTFSSLSTDLLLPTLIHGVIKTEKASKVYFILLALLWDTVTLPLRLITLLSRVCYNAFAQSKEHPLMTYLREKGLDSLDIEGEIVIRVYKETIENGRYAQNGWKYKLFLTDHEVPFSRESFQFSSRGPINPN